MELVDSDGGLRDYKTGFNEVKSDSSLSDDDFRDESPNKSSNPLLSKSPSNDISVELQSASEAHKIIFNICVWFYVNYSGDKDFIRPKYKLSRRTQDALPLMMVRTSLDLGNPVQTMKSYRY